MSQNVERWRGIVERDLDAQASDVPAALVLAIMEAESSGTPGALRGEAALNDASIGLMQLLLATARKAGYTGPAGDRAALTGLFDPATNIHYGIKHLTGLWNQLETVADVASAYNGGVRPEIGFGGVYTGTNPIRVCLERNAEKQCVRWQPVNYGEYGNPEYVNKVLDGVRRYGGAQALPPVVIDGSDDPAPGGGAALALLAAAALAAVLVARKMA